MVGFQHSHPFSAATFANVRIKGPLVNIGFQWSFGFDIRLKSSRLAGSECQIHSTGKQAITLKKLLLHCDIYPGLVLLRPQTDRFLFGI